MEQGVQEGCQTFDQALFMLYKKRKISLDQALINADSANNLRLKIKLAGLKGDEETDQLQQPVNGNGREDPKLDAAKSNAAFRLRKSHKNRWSPRAREISGDSFAERCILSCRRFAKASNRNPKEAHDSTQQEYAQLCELSDRLWRFSGRHLYYGIYRPRLSRARERCHVSGAGRGSSDTGKGR